jgi:hypothetical protein
MSTKTLDRKTAKVGHAYEADLYGWVEDQVALLKANEVGSIDASHITRELDDLGRSKFDKLVSAIRVVLHHLLKWDHQPERRSRSWVITNDEHRDRIVHELNDNPSLRPRIQEATLKAYVSARRQATRETRLPAATFPETCPYDWKDITLRTIPQDDKLPWDKADGDL